jgi:hypothetical protein
MIAGVVLLICLGAVLPLPADSGDPTRRLIGQVDTDSIRYELYVIEDSNGISQEYVAELFTPVCHTNKCYPVYINLFWDLLGNFDRFEMPEGEILTKLDHVPFDDKDYQKLQGILSNERSILGNYSITDLVVSTETVDSNNGVDAVTGATSKTIQSEVISGAVYSCYTLWHLAHGPLTEETKAHTVANHTEQTLVRFLQSDHYPYQYWALERIQAQGKENEPPFVAALLELLRGKNIFLASHLIEALPETVFASEARQRWLWETYLQSPYRMQMDILDRLHSLPLHSPLVTQLLKQLEASNPAQQQAILSVLEKQAALSKEQQGLAVSYLQQGKWEEPLLRLLANQSNPGAATRKTLKKYTVTNQKITKP